MIFTPVNWECGSENMGGFEGKLLLIPECLITSRPTLPALGEVSTTADYVTATGSHVLKEGAQPIYVYATEDTVSYSAENQGEADAQSFKISGEFFHPGNSAEVAALARQINNTRCDIIIEDHFGKQLFIKSARIKPSCDFGKAPTDQRGYKFTYEANSFAPQVELATPVNFEDYKTENSAE